MKKKLILVMVAIPIVALFAAGEVLAGDDCGDDGVFSGIFVHYRGMEQQTDGTYEVRYEVTGNKRNDLTSIDVALPKNVTVVWMPSGYKWSEPGAGAHYGEVDWGEGFWEQRVISGAPQDVGDDKLFFFRVRNSGETTGGLHGNATRGRDNVCTTTVPSGFAQEAVIGYKEVITEGGGLICVKADPTTQCEMVVDCDTGTELPYIPVQQALKIGDNPVMYVAVPGEPCQTFVVDDGIPETTCYYCSGGRCYPVQCVSAEMPPP